MSFVKYRIHEVAKDFGFPTKTVMELFTELFEKPKNHMQVLEDDQLNILFDVLTQRNQSGDLEQALQEQAVARAETPSSVQTPVQEPAAREEEPELLVVEDEPARAPAAPTTPATPAPQAAQPAQSVQPPAAPQNARPAAPAARPAQPLNPARPGDRNQQPRQPGSLKPNTNQPRPAGGQPGQYGAQGQQPRQPGGLKPNTNQPRPAGSQPAAGGNNNGSSNNNNNNQRKRERRVVDTSAATVNAARFDDHVDQLVPDRAQKFQGGKQRIGANKNTKRKGAFVGSKIRSEEQEKIRRLQLEIAKKAPTRVSIPDTIAVGELASRMKKTGADVVKRLIKMGVMASISDVIDYDTAALIAMEMGCKVEKEVVVTIEERLIDDHEDKAEDLKPRAPVVVVMGHVDHGKTSLLDRIRRTNVVSGEAGGITQHIGAYQVQVNGSPITFLDTPGHEAFTAMRARGAMITDIAILVVAADDGIMPQTVESINHAKAANIPIIVAINKMDKPGANPDKIKEQITKYDLVPEEWGGDTIMVPISAKTGMGIDNLLEMVTLTAEMRELKANPNRAARGSVIEARLDRGRGPVATLLVQNGTLHLGDIIIAGTAVGRVRAMTDANGQPVTDAGPSVPVEITGMGEVPSAGDSFDAVEDERMARQLVEQRKQEEKDAETKAPTKVTLEDLFAQIQEGDMKELNIIVKADVQGSAEAVKSSLLKLGNDEVRVKVIHAGVGAITESDVLLASTANAIIVGFNVRPDAAAAVSAQRSKVDVRMYRVIYDCINEIEAAMKGMLAPKYREAVIGHAEIRQTYKVSSIGTIAGCYVLDGHIDRGCKVRVLRDNVVIHEGDLASLRRFKDDVKTVTAGFECGMNLERFNDIKEGDVLESFIMEQIKQ